MSADHSLVDYRVFTTRLTGGAAIAYGHEVEAELSPQAIRYNWGLSKPGTARVSVLKRPMTGTQLTFAGIGCSNRALWIQRGARIVWAGMIWDMDSDVHSPEVTIVADEFTSLFGRFRYRPNYEITPGFPFTFNGRTIVNSQQLIQLSAVNGTIQMATSVSGHQQGASYTPLVRDYEDRYILDLIGEMQRVGQNNQPNGEPPVPGTTQGFEWTQRIDMPGENGNLATDPARAVFHFHGPSAGVDRQFPAVEWGAGTRETAETLRWKQSGRRQATRVKFKGMGQGAQQQWAQVNSTLIGLYPALDGVYYDPSLSTAEHVTAAAQDMVNRVGTPLLDVTATVKVGPHWPWPVSERPPVNIGDRLPVLVRDADLVMRNPGLRVTSLEVEVASGYGSEMVHVGLQPWVPYSTG